MTVMIFHVTLVTDGFDGCTNCQHYSHRNRHNIVTDAGPASPPPPPLGSTAFFIVIILTTAMCHRHEPGMLERTFVLAPLCDIAPNTTHPVTGRTVGQEFATLCSIEATSGPREAADARLPQRILPVRPDLYWPLGGRTYVYSLYYNS